MTKPNLPLLDRIADKFLVADNGCWEWTASTNGHGYGQIRLAPVPASPAKAHRVVYELLVGPIPDGMTLDHLCHTMDETCAGGPTCAHRRCVRPDHLEPVPNAENLRRGRGPSGVASRKTHCPQGHPYAGTNLISRKNGTRACRECERQRDRNRRSKSRS